MSGSGSVSAPPSTGATERPPLDEVMLAMDVVDTLRRRKRVVERELDQAGREADLKERLRKIYHAQGIEVPDPILNEGVRALKEDRFVYKPPEESIRTKLARLYVSRGKWGKWMLAGIAVPIIAWMINFFVFVMPSADLPDAIAAMHRQVVELAKGDRARELADQRLAAAKSALRNDDTGAAKAELRALAAMRDTIELAYTVRIVNRPGERSGVWRVPDLNRSAKNYYVVVEAVGADGRVLEVPITSEEDGRTETVAKWGLRVKEKTFERVARDKRDNGIIEQDRVGYKNPGYLAPKYEIETSGKAITEW